MHLGLLQIKQDDISWLKQVLAEKCHIVWQAKDVAQALGHQHSKPAGLVLVQLSSEGVTPDFQLLLAGLACPVILFSTDSLNHTKTVFTALGAGVHDYVQLHGHSSASAALLLKKIKQQSVLHPEMELAVEHGPLPLTLVAIGASTGGPASLNELIKALPQNVNAAFVIIQHMDGRFSPGLADWLQQSARLKVKLVEHKEKAVAGVVYIAGSDLHLQISAEGRLLYVEDPKDSLFRPSIDVFFTSLSKNWRGAAIGILLTGMGQDGAQGMKLMKDKGWHTIAQDQASSAVYGMPKAAVLLHAVTEVLPLNSIAARLISLCHNLYHK